MARVSPMARFCVVSGMIRFNGTNGEGECSVRSVPREVTRRGNSNVEAEKQALEVC